ncbi:MAG: hypothetical protein IH987_03885 [Planctomycetes bacterium]|nr:hypothetical protein [Planctomycetota bacterium]
MEIAVRSPGGSGEFVTLEPRQQVTPTPHSISTRGLNVDSAGNVGVGTSAPGAQFEVHGTTILGGSVQFGTGTMCYDDPNDRLGSTGVMRIHAEEDLELYVGADWDTSCGFVADGQRTLWLKEAGPQIIAFGDIGINETNPLAKLHIQSGTRDFPSLSTSLHSSENDLLIEGNLPWLSLYGDDVGGVAAGLTFGEVADTTTHKWSIYSRTTDNSGELNVTYGTNLSPTSNTKVMQFKPNGNIGIGTEPSAKLHVLVNSETVDDPEPSQPPVVLRLMSEYDVEQRRRLDFAGTRIQAYDVDAGGVGVYTTLALNPANGGVAIGKTSTANGVKLHVSKSDVGNLHIKFEDVIIEDAGNAWLGLYSDNIGNVGSGITFAVDEPSGTEAQKWAIFARTENSAGDLVVTYGTDDNPTANPVKLQVFRNGTTRVQVLEITGGADIAERFPATEQGQPGMVMAIDPKNPGKLCLARGAYNRCVAGVVSGAGDVPAGAILGSSPGSENSLVIALSGRVWVHCDASERAIQPGDLLTTANRTGYAMAVSDFARATGAMIGKAMTGLSRGETGLVLVLVNLQ